MKLGDRIIQEIRKHGDLGFSTEMLASMLEGHSEGSLRKSLIGLSEQERIVLGSDQRWYLGDIEDNQKSVTVEEKPKAVAAKPEPNQPIEPTDAEPITVPEPAPVPKPVSVTVALETTGTPETVPDFLNKPYRNRGKKEPRPPTIREKLIAWVASQPETVRVPWSDLKVALGTNTSALGKAVETFRATASPELIEKFERIAYRTDSASIKKMIDTLGNTPTSPKSEINPLQPADVSKEPPEHAVNDAPHDLTELEKRLLAKTTRKAKSFAWHCSVLVRLDEILADCMNWDESRPIRRALHEVCELLQGDAL